MEKTKQEYIVFLHQAMNDRTSPAFSEFYQFLVSCFARADVCMEGKVSRDMFDPLVEETVAMPRMYGFAPSNEALYPSSSLRKSARAKMFTEMDRDSNGFITLEEWISFALKHIKGKLAHLPKDYLGGNSDDVTKEEFVDFIKRAVDKSSSEYQQLYFFLLKCFQQGDANKSGAVDHLAFDKMIEAAAAAPRRFGLAPKSIDLFRSVDDRLAKRKGYFAAMDRDKDGRISFDEWLQFAFKHIVGKVAELK